MQQDVNQDLTSWMPEMLPEELPGRGWQVEADLLELMQAEAESDLHARKYERTHWREGRERNFRSPVRSGHH